MRLAVIPARGGSKRIPRKNIKLFGGRPIIAWSIDAALASGCFDRVVVSTDDDEIAAVAAACGAEVPFRRPPSLADDHAGTIAVIRHAIGDVMPQAAPDDLVCCLYATAPFLQAADLAAGLVALRDPTADFALAVTAFRAPIQRALRLDDALRVSMFDPTQFPRRSQDLEPAFHDAGQFCWGRAPAWLQVDNVFMSSCVAIPLPGHRVQDIDTLDDWHRAECMFEALRRSFIQS